MNKDFIFTDFSKGVLKCSLVNEHSYNNINIKCTVLIKHNCEITALGFQISFQTLRN